MSERKTFVVPIVLYILIVSSIILGTSIVSPVFAQENVFSVSPAAVAAKDVPPLGQPYRIPETIVVWNRDNVDRTIFVSSEIPFEENVTPGYQPIPNENWVIPLFENSRSSSFTIPENSYALIQTSFNIPRVENYTGQNWEVWISVERQPILVDDQIEPVTITLVVRMDIETASQLPKLSNIAMYLTLLIAVILVIVAIVAAAWILSRSKGVRRGRALLQTD